MTEIKVPKVVLPSMTTQEITKALATHGKGAVVVTRRGEIGVVTKVYDKVPADEVGAYAVRTIFEKKGGLQPRYYTRDGQHNYQVPTPHDLVAVYPQGTELGLTVVSQS